MLKYVNENDGYEETGIAPKLYGALADGRVSVIVMELIKGKTLNQMKTNLKIVHTLFYALAYVILDLHSCGVIHNDLKLDNVMVEEVT